MSDSIVSNKTNIVYSVIEKREAKDSVLLSFTSSVDSATLASIDARRFRRIALRAEINDTSGVHSPQLRDWSVKFVSLFPELGINSQSIRRSSDSLLEGEPQVVHVRVFNSGRSTMSDPLVTLKYSSQSAPVGSSLQMRLPPLAPDAFSVASFTIPTSGLVGQVRFDVAVSDADSIIEYSKANNQFSSSFFVFRDRERPTLEVLFDGERITNNDYVRQTPTISISMRDNSPLPVTDTSAVQLLLDRQRVNLNGNPLLDYVAPQSGQEKLKLTFKPSFAPGLHYLEFNAKDASGNLIDSLAYIVRFYVSNVNRVDQLYPYPNPSSGPLQFTFRCIGTPPEKGRIKIFTVAGRLIRDIEIIKSELRVGFNRIEWDGRDEDGDLIANGIYFYKLILEQGGSQEEFIDKLAIVR